MTCGLRWCAFSGVLLLAGVTTECRDGRGVPLTLPDLSQVAPTVREQIRDRAAVAESYARSGERDNAGSAYGQLGKVLLAAGYPDAAVTALQRAVAWSPADVRWHHFLGYAYWRTNRLNDAIASFGRATALTAQGDVPALLWLGELHLAGGEPERAEAAFRQALTLEGRNATAEAGLGKVALARRDYSAAVTHLERALTWESQSSPVHYALALAYRGLGDTRRAGVHFRMRRTVEMPGFDERLQDLDGLIESARARDARGRSALARGDWKAAVAHFRRGLELVGTDTDLGPVLHHRLGTALAQLNDAGGARAEFQRALEVAPGFAPAHYALGLTALAANEADAGIRHLLDAVRHDPMYLEAHVTLGDALRFLGRPKDALPHYRHALEISPPSAAALFGKGVSFAKLGRFDVARDRFAEAMALHPGDPAFAVAFARLLAAAPDRRVRDGRQALALVKPIVAHSATVDALEALAMAYAESGAYAEATRTQQNAIALAGHTGQHDRVNGMLEHLRLYEGERPARAPWTAEPVYDRPVR